MASDGRVMSYPLVRGSCDTCGYGFRTRTLSENDRDGLYDSRYALGLDDLAADERRADAYAEVIGELLSRHAGQRASPSAVVEFGSGTGALLTALTSRLPIATALGIEPAEQLAASSRARVPTEVTIRSGYAESADLPEGSFDLCVSVNVIEHASSPSDFLAASRRAVRADGVVIVVCPDGEVAGTELLFADHISSFSLAALSGFAERAGLRLVESFPLPAAQSGFRIWLFLPAAPHARPITTQAAPRLAANRSRYIQGWRELGDRGAEFLSEQGFYVFGTGEFCDLLEAYAPDLIARAVGFVLDTPLDAARNGRPILSTESFIAAKEGAPLLAAVNPRSWKAMQARFAGLGVEIRHPFEFCSLRIELD